MAENTNEDYTAPIEEPDLRDTLTAPERSLRDKFVQEYLIDYDALQAAIRVGYSKSLAKQYATRFMLEPYTLQQIRLREAGPLDETPDAAKQRVMVGLYREANYRGVGCSQSARVAALAKLAAIHGMDAPTKRINEITGPDGQPLGAGGIFVVPGIMTTEEWEKQAADQQAALVASPPAGTPETKAS